MITNYQLKQANNKGIDRKYTSIIKSDRNQSQMWGYDSEGNIPEACIKIVYSSLGSSCSQYVHQVILYTTGDVIYIVHKVVNLWFVLPYHIPINIFLTDMSPTL